MLATFCLLLDGMPRKAFVQGSEAKKQDRVWVTIYVLVLPNVGGRGCRCKSKWQKSSRLTGAGGRGAQKLFGAMAE